MSQIELKSKNAMQFIMDTSLIAFGYIFDRHNILIQSKSAGTSEKFQLSAKKDLEHVERCGLISITMDMTNAAH